MTSRFLGQINSIKRDLILLLFEWIFIRYINMIRELVLGFIFLNKLKT